MALSLVTSCLVAVHPCKNKLKLKKYMNVNYTKLFKINNYDVCSGIVLKFSFAACKKSIQEAMDFTKPLIINVFFQNFWPTSLNLE